MRVEGIGKPPGCKLIRLTAEVEQGAVRAISIRGDFFAVPEEGFDRAEERIRDIPLQELAASFDDLLGEEGVEVQGINGTGVATVLKAALQGEVYESLR